MRVHVEARALKHALALIAKTRPYRGVFRFRAEGDRLWVEASGDLDLSLGLKAKVEHEGTATGLIGVFAALAKTLSGEALIASSQAGLEVAAGQMTTQLTAPVLEEVPSAQGGPVRERVSAAELARALRAVVPFTATEEYRAVFRGVQIEHGPGRFRLVATDGFRLGYYDFRPAEENAEAKVVLPREAASLLQKLAQTGEVAIGFDEGRFWAQGEDFVLQSGLLEGTFPDYQRVLPAVFIALVQVEAKALAEALGRLMPLADKIAPRVDLHVHRDMLLLTVEGDYGRGEDRIPATVEGEGLSLALTPQFLLDALEPIEGEATLALSGATTPLTVQGEGPYVGVLVPLRVEEYATPRTEAEAA